MIDVNLKGTLYITKAILPFLKMQNKGIILNVSSTSGINPKQLQSAYIASKFAIQGFTEGLKEDRINTNLFVLESSDEMVLEQTIITRPKSH